MSTLVKARPSRVAKTVKHRRVTPRRPSGRRAHASRWAPRATQRVSQRRPGGVRGPRLANTTQSDTSRHLSAVPPAVLGVGMRLTDRGLAVAMAVAIALVIAAVVCITTTAARVTAEPPGGGVTAASVTR